jgi:hypothetical protein
MQLDEALGTIADARKRLAQLAGRIVASARYQEGEAPAESADALITEAGQLMDRIEDLAYRINLTNSLNALPDGRTLTQALAHRDMLGTRHKLLQEAADAASGEGGSRGFYARRARSELVEKTDLDVAALRSTATAVAVERRELDLQIQRAGMTTELIET